MIILTQDLLKKLYPAISIAQAKVLVDKQSSMAEILATPQRAAMCFANIFVESRGFSVLTEDIHYSADRMAHVWPQRYPGGASAVIAKYGQAPGWQNNAFDDLYGNRMGNRPGTHDGSAYIGRSAVQITGRDGYANIGSLTGLDLVNHSTMAADINCQPEIIGAFWKWKALNGYADRGDVTNVRKIWNGGLNGLSTVQAQYSRIFKILETYIPATAAANVQAPIATRDDLLASYQEELTQCGYHEVGEPDGKIGGKTLGAIKAFCTDRGISDTGYPSVALGNELTKAHQDDWHRPIAPARAFATKADVAEKVSSVAPTQKAGFFAKIGAWFTGGTAVGKAALLAMPDAHDTAYPYINMIQEWFTAIPGWVPFAIVAGVAVAIVVSVNKATTATQADYQQGKIN